MSELDAAMFFGKRAGIAILAGLIMGIERTLSGHSAGIKTLVFVSLGSSIYTSLSFYIVDIYQNIDPSRILGQVVTGIGFIGAGVIFQNDKKISGLTSAAMVWVACSLGMVSGTGLFWVPIFASITLVIIMILLKKFDKLLDKSENSVSKN
jgi:putative Mg2+ transporter-C (MgtC) family protein